MNISKIAYWVSTALVCFLMGFSGFNDITHNPDFVGGMKHLGYPEYMMDILGIAKMAAVIILLIPFRGRLKEWAYAGVMIDLIGAEWSHIASGDGFQPIPMVALVLTLVSNFYYNRQDD